MVWFLLPLTPLVLWAFAERWPATAALPGVWQLRIWDTLDGAGVTAAFGRSAALATAVAVLATAAGAAAGKALAQHRDRWTRLGAAVLLAPVIVPPFAVALGLDVVLLRLRIPPPIGVVLILVVSALPYTTYVLRATYASYDLRFEEQARTLGASPALVRRSVELPLVARGVAVAAFLAFLVGWSDYVVTLAVGGGQFVTYPLLLGSAAAGTGNDAFVGALSLSALVPPVAVLGLLALLGRRRSRPAPGAG